MKISLIINVHSHLDLITNSSTELFVTGGERELETVTSILQEMWDRWNQLAQIGSFGSHLVKNKRQYLNDNKEVNPSNNLNEILEVYIFTKEIFEEREGLDGWGYEKESNIGKIIIESVCDNTIPYNMFEWIEEAFSAKRYHLG